MSPSVPAPRTTVTAPDGASAEVRAGADGVPDAMNVLLVDDDVAYRTLCDRYLRRDPDHSYRVSMASSGTQASALHLPDFDCILIDYFLPDGTGTEFIAQWHTAYRAALPPVVVMSAGGGERAASEAVRTHAIDYLAKADLTATALRRSIGNATEKGELRRQVFERQRELKRTNEQLARRTVEIERFYHTVSHEMKTPLSATREFVALVRDGVAGEVSARQGELLDLALESCDQITRQFGDLLDLTRMETGKLRLEMQLTSVQPVLDRCLAMVATRANEKGVSLSADIDAGLPDVLIDAGRIAQVITNLLTNAVKFTDPGGSVRVRAFVRPCRVNGGGREPGRIEVRVTDTGRGIARADLTRVFERLYQAERHAANDAVIDPADPAIPSVGDDSGDGLGLGLSIAREIVRGHGGNLAAYSRLGVGSVFRFSMPPGKPPAAPLAQ